MLGRIQLSIRVYTTLSIVLNSNLIYLYIAYISNEVKKNVDDKHDFRSPIITINSPSTNQIYGMQAPIFDIDIDEPNLDESWYSLNNGDNTTFTVENQFKQIEWDKLGNGTVLITFYAKDKAGNFNFSFVTVQKDALVPEIIILSPIEGFTFNSTPPVIIADILDINLFFISVAVNNQTPEGHSILFIDAEDGTINRLDYFLDIEYWNILPDGEIVIILYARDIVGNENYVEVIIIKNTSEPTSETTSETTTPSISGYLLLPLLGFMCLASILYYYKKFNCGKVR